MATPKICSIPGCDKLYYGRSYCQTHYQKWWKYGDPLKTVKPDCLGWIERHVDYSGDDCLIWPFAVNTGGYPAAIPFRGKKTRAHRAMCTLAHGDPPSEKHHAAHLCGNGHLCCINPRHLRWKTTKENAADTIRHGNTLRGHKHHGVILTEDDVVEIRKVMASKSRQGRALARKYGVNPTTILAIHHRRSWRWL